MLSKLLNTTMHILMHCIVIERKLEWGGEWRERERKERGGEVEGGERRGEGAREEWGKKIKGGAGNNFKWATAVLWSASPLPLHTWLHKCKTYKPS